MTIDPAVRAHRALGDISRYRILEELRNQGPLDSRQLGRLVGLHPNTVRSHVDQLIEAALVRTVSAPAAGRGRPPVLYEAIGDGALAQQSGYRLLAEILASYLATSEQPQAVAESAGRAWGSYLMEKTPPFAEISAGVASRKLVDLFTELGFMPELVTDGEASKMLLHRCPFRQVAESNQQVVCSVHLGMLRGALAEMGTPIEAVRLEPFVEPNLCVAHLRGVRGPTPGRGERAWKRPPAG
jgi:predicted ArsR family transcriptional regulator